MEDIPFQSKYLLPSFLFYSAECHHCPVTIFDPIRHRNAGKNSEQTENRHRLNVRNSLSVMQAEKHIKLHYIKCQQNDNVDYQK